MKRQSLLLLIILHALTTDRASVLVGKTEGAMTVGATGAANYTIPIKLLPGLSDFVPQLSLTYNSQAGNGLAGFGWNISGMSAITISPRNVYFDGEAECIYRGEDNAYYLDGMRLLPVSGTNGQQGAVYRTENEHFSHIEITSWNGSTPTTFTVKTTDGTTKKIVEREGSMIIAYNYLNVGDRFRYHPQFNFPYEHYDKSRAPYIGCVSCGAHNPTGADRCQRCNTPRLK